MHGGLTLDMCHRVKLQLLQVCTHVINVDAAAIETMIVHRYRTGKTSAAEAVLVVDVSVVRWRDEKAHQGPGHKKDNRQTKCFGHKG